ncbi:PIR protein, putative [Plasmodium sp.]|nr:PIR protein, putative [Plasmodium sp.]
MKIHYINILLFALLLNMLVNTHKKTPYTTPYHTQTTRSLCECDLYMPNYDNDPEMKEVMENFNRQTSQRLHEYDERMIEKRQKCKDKCDKEIQKIILKDKLKKELMDKFTTLQTDIQNDAIRTCVCEKSLADKTEKFCLNCGVNVGGGVTLSSGVLGGIGGAALSAWKPTALKLAIAAAKDAAAAEILAAANAAGNAKGMEIVIHGLKYLRVDELFLEIFNSFVDKNIYTEVTNIANSILGKYFTTCTSLNSGLKASAACSDFQLKLLIHLPDGSTYGTSPVNAIPQGLKGILEEATQGAKAAEALKSAKLTTEITKKQTALIEAGFDSSTTSIYASIIVILIIVLIMVIIYLILRYRRKKKMKKKLQYIKLLEE